MSKRRYSVMTENDDLYTALSCSICLELFKFPKQLPNCSHTFCAACLENLVTSSHNELFLYCPNCRTRSLLLDGGVKAFQTNIVAQHLVERLNMEEFVEGNACQPAEETTQEVTCTHVFNNTRTSCEHCNRRFCDRCRPLHLSSIRSNVLRTAESFTNRQAVIDLNGFRKKLETATAVARHDFENRMRVIEAALKAEEERFSADLDRIVAQEIDKVMSSVAPCSRLMLKVDEITKVPESQLSVRELCDILDEFQNREKIVDTAIKNVESLVPVTLTVQWDTNFIAKFGNWKILFGEKLPKQLSLAAGSSASASIEESIIVGPVEFANKSNQVKEEAAIPASPSYATMTVATTGSTKDALGRSIRLPNRICSVGSDRVAVVHDINRISIYGWTGRVIATVKVYDPKKTKSDFTIADVACDDQNRLFITDGALIAFFSLSAATSRMPECVYPTLFANKSIHEFHGLAVCAELEELYTAEGPAIAVFSIREKVKRCLMAIPNSCRVLGCFYGGLPGNACRIYFSTMTSDSVAVIDRNTQTVSSVAEKGCGPGDVHKVTGVGFDQKGNLLVADARNARIQVISPANKLLATFSHSDASDANSQSQHAASRMRPFGVATVFGGMPPNTLRVAVPDYGSHKVYFFESKP